MQPVRSKSNTPQPAWKTPLSCRREGFSFSVCRHSFLRPDSSSFSAVNQARLLGMTGRDNTRATWRRTAIFVSRVERIKGRANHGPRHWAKVNISLAQMDIASPTATITTGSGLNNSPNRSCSPNDRRPHGTSTSTISRCDFQPRLYYPGPMRSNTK